MKISVSGMTEDKKYCDMAATCSTCMYAVEKYDKKTNDYVWGCTNQTVIENAPKIKEI